MPWRTITAQQYVDNSDPDGFDEARIETEFGYREVWDAGPDDAGMIHIHTAQPNPIVVAPDHPIRVR